MIEYLPEFLTIASLHLLGLIAPGPDFILVSRNSLIHSRKIGIFTAIGLAIGMSVHVIYSLVGIGFIISQSIVLFSIIKFLGAGYLIYIGYKSLTARTGQADPEQANQEVQPGLLSNIGAIRMGFLTNVLNPKVTLFFLSIFTQVIDGSTPLSVRLLYGLEMSLATLVWFGLVSVLLSNSVIKNRFTKIQRLVGKVMGAALIVLGVKVALTRN